MKRIGYFQLSGIFGIIVVLADKPVVEVLASTAALGWAVFAIFTKEDV